MSCRHRHRMCSALAPPRSIAPPPPAAAFAAVAAAFAPAAALSDAPAMILPAPLLMPWASDAAAMGSEMWCESASTCGTHAALSLMYSSRIRTSALKNRWTWC